MPKDRELIRRTGIAVLQVPAGVSWQAGDTARLIVGIAARSDEHLDILSNLTGLLYDDEMVARLARHRRSAGEVIAALTAPRVDAAATSEDGGPDEAGLSVEAVVGSSHGLHARPATAFVEAAKGFDAEVIVRHGTKRANGKSLAALLRLGVKAGGAVRIVARGPQAEAALAALKGLIEAAEDEEIVLGGPSHGWSPRAAGATVRGLAASPGLAIGPLRLLRQRRIVVERCAKDPERERERLSEAISTARAELRSSIWRSRRSPARPAPPSSSRTPSSWPIPTCWRGPNGGSLRARAPAGPGGRRSTPRRTRWRSWTIPCSPAAPPTCATSARACCAGWPG